MHWHDITAAALPLILTRPLPDGLRPYAVLENDRYHVKLATEQTPIGEVVNIMVRRMDGEPIRSWADLQEIKRDMGFADRQAVEIFPPDAKLVDCRNLYWLRVLPEGYELPFGRLHEHVPPVGIKTSSGRS